VTANKCTTQGYDQSDYNQQRSWGQQQGYGSYGATGDHTYSQQDLYAFVCIVTARFVCIPVYSFCVEFVIFLCVLGKFDTL
jgi:hypothetical protein